MQSHKEARLWNDVFVEAQDMLNIPRGTIKVRQCHGCCVPGQRSVEQSCILLGG